MNLMIVIYKQPDKSKSVQLSRSLHGYVDKSNHGQYSYERKGLLDKIPYQKLMNGVFILRKEDAERLLDLLEKYEAEYYAGVIEKTSESSEILSE